MCDCTNANSKDRVLLDVYTRIELAAGFELHFLLPAIVNKSKMRVSYG
jgi:hypothetical protein